MNEVTMFEDLWDELDFMSDEEVEEEIRRFHERNDKGGDR